MDRNGVGSAGGREPTPDRLSVSGPPGLPPSVPAPSHLHLQQVLQEGFLHLPEATVTFPEDLRCLGKAEHLVEV